MNDEPGPFILYHGIINAFGALQVEDACIQLLPHKPSHLTLLICSNGGDVYAGVGLYNFLKMMPFEVRTHTVGICGSIALTVYLAGARRTATEASMFMLHAASYVEGPRKGQVAENTQLISKPFKTELGWDDSRIASYFESADERYISLEQATTFGIVEEIVAITIAPNATILRIDPNGPTNINLALDERASD